MSNKHTRKTFFAKAAAALAGFGLLGGARLSAKTNASATPANPAVTGENAPFAIRTDTRAVSRTDA